jgi:acyl-CoA hydrolase
MVALDADRSPARVPRLLLRTAAERREDRAAHRRRALRLRQRGASTGAFHRASGG